MLVLIKDVVFGYDDKILLDGVNVCINEGDRIGLVGANGEGKTTFLNLIMGNLEPVDGEITRKSGLKVGYMKQNQGLDSSLTVYEEMKTVFSELLAAEEKMRALESEIARIDHDSQEFRIKSAEYERWNSVFTAGDGYDIDVKIKTVLFGMGFGGRFGESIRTMSGGEKTRLMLCRLLLAAPELLILDEPTNHLDLKTLFWLEKYLAGYKGAILTVSHDRYFLDKTVTSVWDLENRTVTPYKGNYTKYKLLKRDSLIRREKEYEKQQKQVASMLDYAQRNIARATTSNSAKSRLHQLANMEIMDKPYIDRRTPKFSFSFEKEPVKDVLTVKGLTLGFTDRELFSDAEFVLTRGTKTALLGDNGTGKTTLIRYIMSGKGEKTGKVLFGKNAKAAYYDQENLNLDPEKTVIDEIWFKNHKLSQTEIRAALARMLLSSEDIDKKVGVLSGGERAKLAFALLMLEKGNFLILDEPTNHLDLVAREALEEALRKFEGTLLFVSHDRYFISSLADNFLEIEDGRIDSFKGTYDEFTDEKQKNEEEKRSAAEEKRPPETKPENKGFRSAKDRAKEAEHRQRVAFLEKKLRELENEQSSLNEELAASPDYKRVREISERLCEIESELDETLAEWTQIA